MAKIKVPHINNFTIVDNGPIRDKNLSLSAMGLMVRMLSLPEGAECTINELSSICKESKDTISRYLKELEVAGYLIRKQKRNNGKHAGIEYILLERPNLFYTEC